MNTTDSTWGEPATTTPRTRSTAPGAKTTRTPANAPGGFLAGLLARLKPAPEPGTHATAVGTLLKNAIDERANGRAELTALEADLADGDAAAITAALGGAKDTRKAGERIAALTVRLDELDRTIARLQTAEQIATYRDAHARAAALLPRYAAELDALAVTLDAAARAWQTAAVTAEALRHERLSQDTAWIMTPEADRPALRPGVDGSLPVLVIDWRDAFDGRDGNPSRLSSWRADLEALKARVLG